MKRTILLGLLLAAVSALGLAACAAGPKTVNVTLKDFEIDADQTTFKAGRTYQFVVTNEGSLNHEFMVMAPMMDGQDMTMEQMDQMALGMIDADTLPPGTTQTLEVTFSQPSEPGALEFACHVGHHYEQGMHVPITVEK